MCLAVLFFVPNRSMASFYAPKLGEMCPRYGLDVPPIAGGTAHSELLPFNGERGCFENVPPIPKNMPPNVPPDLAGTWQTYADVRGRQKLVSIGEKEKGRTLLERYGL